MSRASRDGSSQSGEPTVRARGEVGEEPAARKVGFRPARLTVGSGLAGGRFRVEGLLGEGGMGVVYEAFDAIRGEMVAIKTITRPGANEAYRLKSEFRSLADIVHPNLVRLHELFVDDGRCFFSMEIVEGLPFHIYVRPKGKLDVARLRDCLGQLLAGVAAIHDAGKLHRDLKPNNVLVDPDQRLVVLDFGLVVERGRAAGKGVDEGKIVGTPGYMAPEQALGEGASAAIDMYSVGAMLFEALSGVRPRGMSDTGSFPPRDGWFAPSVRSFAPDVPEDLAHLCDRLRAIDAERRPTQQEAYEHLQLAFPRGPISRRVESRRTQIAVTMLGREGELEELRTAYRASLTGGRPVVALVSGESGIGKSTLVDSMLAELDGGPALVLRGRCYEREAIPYKAFDAAVDELSRFLRKATAAGLPEVADADMWALRRLFPVLERVTTVERSAEGSTDVREQRRRGFLALGELFASISLRRPLVIFIDDLQWSDGDSTTLLLHLLRQTRSLRVLVLGTHRNLGDAHPDALAALYDGLTTAPRIDLRTIELGPLGDGASEELARALSFHDAAALAREAGGNPFLIGELARWPGRATSPGLRVSPVDVSLTDAVQQRVAGLQPAERRLLEVLAVAARPLTLRTAAQAAELEGAHAVMDSLRAECLGRSAGPSGAVECYHDRIRDAVMAGLSSQQLRSHHLSLATALASQRTVDPEHLYTHYEQGGQRALAAEHAREAASRAVRALAFERAIGLCDRALALGDTGDENALELRRTRADALAYAGRGPEASEAYLSAAGLAEPAQAVVLQRYAAEQLLMSGDLRRGQRLLSDSLSQMGIGLPRNRPTRVASMLLLRGLTRLRGVGHVPQATVARRDRHRLEALVASASALSRTDPLAAAEVAVRHLRLAMQVGTSVDVARALAWELLFSAMLEAPTSWLTTVVARAREAAERSEDLEAQASFHRHHGFYLRSKSHPDMQGALVELERSLAIHREHPLPTSYYDRPWGEWNRDVVRSYLGRFEEIARDLPGHLDEAQRRSDMCIYPVWASMVLPRLAVGEQDAAEEDFAHAFRRWPRDAMSLQNVCLLEGGTLLANAVGDPLRFTAEIERAYRIVTRSPLYRSGSFVGTVAGHRARNAARRAELSSDPAERRELADTMLRSARWMGRSRRAWADHTDAPVHAAAAHLKGDADAAVKHLRRGVERLSGVPILAQACRHQLGALLGGDEGRELMEESEVFFRAGGAIDGSHLPALLIPGFASLG